jgi:hypothetical protein
MSPVQVDSEQRGQESEHRVVWAGMVGRVAVAMPGVEGGGGSLVPQHPQVWTLPGLEGVMPAQAERQELRGLGAWLWAGGGLG